MKTFAWYIWLIERKLFCFIGGIKMMDIEENTIKFRTYPDMYEKNKSGKKANITQALTDSEFEWFYELQQNITDICIKNSQTEETFTRKLIDISRDYFNTKNHDTVNFLTFTWEHKN